VKENVTLSARAHLDLTFLGFFSKFPRAPLSFLKWSPAGSLVLASFDHEATVRALI